MATRQETIRIDQGGKWVVVNDDSMPDRMQGDLEKSRHVIFISPFMSGCFPQKKPVVDALKNLAKWLYIK